MYRPGVRYDLIAQAARRARCPVFANGNVHSAAQAQALLAKNRRAWLDDRRGRHPQSVLLRPDRAQLRGDQSNCRPVAMC